MLVYQRVDSLNAMNQLYINVGFNIFNVVYNYRHLPPNILSCSIKISPLQTLTLPTRHDWPWLRRWHTRSHSTSGCVERLSALPWSWQFERLLGVWREVSTLRKNMDFVWFCCWNMVKTCGIIETWWLHRKKRSILGSKTWEIRCHHYTWTFRIADGYA